MNSRSNRGSWVAILAIAYGLATSAHVARAQQVRAAWDWDKRVFVQEYWHDGNPHYAIANLRDEPITITIKPLRYERDEQSGLVKAVMGAPVAGPLPVPAQGTIRIDGDNMVAEGALSFMADGLGQIGVVPAPKIRDDEYRGYIHDRFNDHRIRVYDGVNGLGGQHLNIWTEQDRRVYRGGDVATIEVRIRRGIDKVEFRRHDEDNDRRRAIRRVPVTAVASESLPVRADDNAFTVHAREALMERPEHTVTVSLQLPDVHRPTMVLYTCWVHLDNGSSYEMTRGLLVEPDPHDNY